MKYALFPVLLLLCTGCGTLATPGTTRIDQVAPEADSIHIASTAVDNDDRPAGLSGYPKGSLVSQVAAQDTPSADIPDEAFLDTDYRDANPFSTEPDSHIAHPPAHEKQEECVIHCNKVARWAIRNQDLAPFIFDLAYWGGSELVRLFSGSKKKGSRTKMSGKSRRSGGRSVRKANRTQSNRTPNKDSSRGRGRR